MDIFKGKKINYGTDSTDSVDYPDFGHPVATDVAEGKVDLELLFAEAVTERNDCKQTSESTRRFMLDERDSLARQHNDANIISIPARYFYSTGGRDGRNVYKYGI
jgi:ribose 5-phosphate isomerase B